jgi:tryptophanyl-tRNA synthetase
MDQATVENEGAQIRKKRVLSGIQPSGDLHLGNYLGSIKRWVERQHEKENFFCIVDLHAITVPQDPALLRHRTRAVAALYIASGLDPESCTIFVQSHVTAHAEACWLLNCVTPLGWLERMTQYKDKAERASSDERISAGLLDYPVLMAGDILLYSADEVPVGEDQKQHVELSRDIAQRFNNMFGETFVVPKPVIPEVGARVMGFDDPSKKMSKSYEGVRGHLVKMIDEPKEIERTIKRAVTDSGNEIVVSGDPEKAGVNNLLGIYKVITGKTTAQVEADFASARGYGDLKKAVADVVIEELAPIRQRYDEIMSDPVELDRILAKGAEQARAVADPKLREMKERIGLVLPQGGAS